MMKIEDFFFTTTEMAAYRCQRELPEWTAEQLTGKPVQLDAPARLHVLHGAFRFCAYDEEDNVIFETVFDVQHQQTLLKPGIRHSAAALDDTGRYLLQIYGENK